MSFILFLFFFFPASGFCLLAAEKYEPCRNPGAASTSMQSTEKAFYQAGETLSFSCQPGYELQGQATIYCIPGHPSQWNNTPPACRGTAHQHGQTMPQLEARWLSIATPAPTLIKVLFAFAASTVQYVNERKLDGEYSADSHFTSLRKCMSWCTFRLRNHIRWWCENFETGAWGKF